MFWKCCAYIESKCEVKPCVGDASLQAKTPVAQHCSLTNYQNRDNFAALLQRYLSPISCHGMSNENSE
jgi:hypothetical protein